MTTARKIATNTTFILIGNIVVKAFALLISINLARYLGVEYFGEYNFVIAYLSFFTFVANFGLDSILIRDISRNKFNVNILVSNVLMFRILTSLFSIILSISIINFLDYSAETIIYVSLLSSILLLQGLSYLFESIFHSKLKMHYSSIGMIISKLIYTFFVFYLIISRSSLIIFFYTYIIAELIRTLIAIHYSKKFVKIDANINTDLWKYLLKESIPFIVGYALFIIYYRIDILMLSGMEGNLAVGYYSAAYKLTDPLLFIPGAFASVLMPIMAKKYISDQRGLKETYYIGSKYILQIMFPLSIFLYFFSQDIIDLLYTDDYYASIYTLKILSLTIVVNSLNSIQNSLLVASDRQKLNTISVGICCILNIVLNIVLIPIYSYNGAAIATLISVLFLFLIQLLFIRNELYLLPLSKHSYVIVFVSLFMGLFLSKASGFYLVILSIICIFVYIFILYLTGVLSKKDLFIFKSIFMKDI